MTRPTPARRAPLLRILALFAVSAALETPVRAADVVTETRPVGNFKTVRLVGSADLVLTQGDSASLKVEADKDRIADLKAESRGDELVLSYEPKSAWHWSSHDRGPRFILTAKALERIATAGSGDIRADSWTATGDLEIAVAGSSDVTFGTLAARKLLVRISGSGDVKLSGGVLEQNVRIAGSGDYQSGALQSASATISIGGSGNAILWARDSLAIKVAGSGDVKYYGKPAVSQSIAGSGSVTSLGDRP